MHLDERQSGAASQIQCLGQREHIPAKKDPSWEVGLALPPGNGSAHSSQVFDIACARNCIIFYTPHPGPDLSLLPVSAVQNGLKFTTR